LPFRARISPHFRQSGNSAKHRQSSGLKWRKRLDLHVAARHNWISRSIYL
jgi:hypothetical protein